MMNYQSTPRSNRPRVFAVKNVLQFVLFVAFSLWLLYQIRQSNGNGGPAGRQLSNEHVADGLGRKGSVGLLKSDPVIDSGLTLQDVTNPGEDGEIARFPKEIDEVESRIKNKSLKKGNDDNTLQQGQDGTLTTGKSNVSFSDENGIPQHVRDKYVGNESSKVRNRTPVGIRNVIATRVGIGSNRTLEES